jgi:outer membrane lipoprotein-sorting protein
MRSKKFLLIVSVLFFCILPESFSQSGTEVFKPVEDPAELLEQLNSASAGIQTIQSRFIQKKQLEFLDETIVSRGQFWFRRENQLRWAYEEPFEYAIIINGGKFYIKDGESVTAYDIDSNEAFRQINHIIVGVVQGSILEKDRFDMQSFENTDHYLVKLTPRESHLRDVISGMEICFDKKDLTVSEIIMRESETDHTVITFFEKRFNETIPDPVFSADL